MDATPKTSSRAGIALAVAGIMLALGMVASMLIAPVMLLPTMDPCQGSTAVDANGVGVGGVGYQVMSYNIRAASLSAPTEMQDHKGDYAWSHRGPLVAQTIANANPDLIGLQEATRTPSGELQLDAIRDNVDGYTWLYWSLSDTIGFRTTMFTLLDKGTITLNSSAVASTGARTVRRAVWAKLRDNDDQTVFYFVSLHAQFGQTASAAAARSAGWTRLVDGLEAINPDNKKPTVMVGDFNAFNDETKSVYRDHLRKLGAAGFVEAAEQAPETSTVDRAASYNGWGDTIGGKFYYKAINRTSTGHHMDYVWTGGQAQATSWQVYTGPAPTWKTIKGVNTPFAPWIASDHWPVLAKVAFGESYDDDTTLSTTTSTAAPDSTASVPGFSQSQIGIAAQIVAAGQALGLDTWTITVGVMTGIGESSLRNLGYGDAAGPDSRGVFQQRSQGWGTLAERMNPYTAATSFFKALVKVTGYRAMTPTKAAHATQRNADPNHYSPFWDDAVQLVAAILADPALAAQLSTATTATCVEGGAVLATGDWGEVITFALGLVGQYPYTWGGGNLNGPTGGGFDCSSFIWYVVYQKTGVDINKASGISGLTRRTQNMAGYLQSKGVLQRTSNPDELHAGDIVFYAHGDSLRSIYHVALVTKDGWIVEEPGRGRYVQHNQIKDRMVGDIWGYARFDPAQFRTT